ncbi:unnamed protein product, partial [Owenia fusiformis]
TTPALQLTTEADGYPEYFYREYGNEIKQRSRYLKSWARKSWFQEAYLARGVVIGFVMYIHEYSETDVARNTTVLLQIWRPSVRRYKYALIWEKEVTVLGTESGKIEIFLLQNEQFEINSRDKIGWTYIDDIGRISFDYSYRSWKTYFMPINETNPVVGSVHYFEKEPLQAIFSIGTYIDTRPVTKDVVILIMDVTTSPEDAAYQLEAFEGLKELLITEFNYEVMVFRIGDHMQIDLQTKIMRIRSAVIGRYYQYPEMNKKLRCIGFGIGAHICVNIVDVELAWITALAPTDLDPSREYMYNRTYSLPPNFQHLSASKAQFVEVIHTYAKFEDKLGDVDYFMIADHCAQGDENNTLCRHRHAIQVFKESLMTRGSAYVIKSQCPWETIDSCGEFVIQPRIGYKTNLRGRWVVLDRIVSRRFRAVTFSITANFSTPDCAPEVINFLRGFSSIAFYSTTVCKESMLTSTIIVKYGHRGDYETFTTAIGSIVTSLIAHVQTTASTIVGTFAVTATVRNETIHIDEIAEYIGKCEGKKNMAYDNSKGNRTVGIGFNMERPGARKVWETILPGVDFDKVYNKQLALRDDQIKTLFKADLGAQFIPVVRHLIPGFEVMCAEVQAAIVDALYRGHLSPAMQALIKKRKWKEAAKEYTNQGDYRNALKGRRGFKDIKIRMDENKAIFEKLVGGGTECSGNTINTTISPSTSEPKTGNCPSVPSGTVGICVNSCLDDYSCPGVQKCCSNGCGHICKDPFAESETTTPTGTTEQTGISYTNITVDATLCYCLGGQCQHTSKGCQGGNFYSDQCIGHDDVKCCVKNTSEDNQCTAQQGGCKLVSDGCFCGEFTPGLCGGPSNRQCCLVTP